MSMLENRRICEAYASAVGYGRKNINEGEGWEVFKDGIKSMFQHPGAAWSGFKEGAADTADKGAELGGRAVNKLKSWGDDPSKIASDVGGAGWEIAKDLGTAAMHPIDTVKYLKENPSTLIPFSKLWHTDDWKNYHLKDAVLDAIPGASAVTRLGRVARGGAKVAAAKGAAKVAKKGAEAAGKIAKRGAEAAEKTSEVVKKGAEVAEKGANTAKKGIDVAKKSSDVPKRSADTSKAATGDVKPSMTDTATAEQRMRVANGTATQADKNAVALADAKMDAMQAELNAAKNAEKTATTSANGKSTTKAKAKASTSSTNDSAGKTPSEKTSSAKSGGNVETASSDAAKTTNGGGKATAAMADDTTSASKSAAKAEPKHTTSNTVNDTQSNMNTTSTTASAAEKGAAPKPAANSGKAMATKASKDTTAIKTTAAELGKTGAVKTVADKLVDAAKNATGKGKNFFKGAASTVKKMALKGVDSAGEYFRGNGSGADWWKWAAAVAAAGGAAYLASKLLSSEDDDEDARATDEGVENDTHFAVDMATGKIVYSWDYSDIDPDNFNYPWSKQDFFMNDLVKIFGADAAERINVYPKSTLIYLDKNPMNPSNWEDAEGVELDGRTNESVDENGIDAVKEQMAGYGFEYDDIDSDPDNGYIVFFSENGLFPSGGFKSWDDVKDWADNVLIDESVDEDGIETVKRQMAEYGFEYDDIDSDPDNGYIVFFSENGLFPSGGFSSWEDVKDWAENVLMDETVESVGDMVESVFESCEVREAKETDGGNATSQTVDDFAGKTRLQKDGMKVLAKTDVKNAAKHGGKVVRKFMAKKAGAKVAAKAGMKAAGKVIGKSLLKKVPVIGLGVGAKFAYDRAKENDYVGAAGEIASGVASMIPGPGTVASLGIDGALAVKDYIKAKDDDKKANAMAKNEAVQQINENEEFPIPCDGLAKRKTVRAAQNYIYDNILPLTKGFFRDEAWENVHKIFHVMSDDIGMNVNFGVRNDNYYQHGYSLDRSSKAYQFDAKFRNFDGKNITINGQIIATFCGTADNPMSKYDMAFQLF